jgi:hypothetical protein
LQETPDVYYSIAFKFCQYTEDLAVLQCSVQLRGHYVSICRGFLSSVARKSLTETSLTTKVVFYWKLPQTTYRRMLPSMYTHHSFAVNLRVVLNAQRLVLCSPFCLFALEARCLDALRQWRYVGFGGTDSATGFRSRLGRLCFGRRVKMLHYRIRD